MTEKIKVLFLAANPVDTRSRLRLEEEVREISKKLSIGSARDAFELVSEWAVRPSDLQEVLLRHEPEIVHFSGHGSETQGIVLEDNAGNSRLMDKQALIRLFEILKDNIRIVVLNACYAKDQAEGLARTIDFTVGMNTAITDKAAIVFSAYFYQSLAFGRTVKQSFELACNELDLEGIPGSNIPEFLTRSGVNPSELLLPRRKPTIDSPIGDRGEAGDDEELHSRVRSPRVFLSYVRENSVLIDRLREDLRNRRIATWLDRDDLDPGSRWKLAIRRAIRNADFFVACFSADYDSRNESWMNEELHVATERLRSHHLDRTWFIPVKLSPCEVPDFDLGGGTTLNDLQHVDLYTDWEAGVGRLAAALLAGAPGDAAPPVQSHRQPRQTAVNDSVKRMSVKLGKTRAHKTDMIQKPDDSRQIRDMSVDINELNTDELIIEQ